MSVLGSVVARQLLSQLQASHEGQAVEHVSRESLVGRLEHELDKALAFRQRMGPFDKKMNKFSWEASNLILILYILYDFNWCWNRNLNGDMHLPLDMNWVWSETLNLLVISSGTQKNFFYLSTGTWTGTLMCLTTSTGYGFSTSTG